MWYNLVYPLQSVHPSLPTLTKKPKREATLCITLVDQFTPSFRSVCIDRRNPACLSSELSTPIMTTKNFVTFPYQGILGLTSGPWLGWIEIAMSSGPLRPTVFLGVASECGWANWVDASYANSGKSWIYCFPNRLGTLPAIRHCRFRKMSNSFPPTGVVSTGAFPIRPWPIAMTLELESPFDPSWDSSRNSSSSLPTRSNFRAIRRMGAQNCPSRLRSPPSFQFGMLAQKPPIHVA